MIPASRGVAVHLDGGDRLTVIDLEGQQVADMVAVLDESDAEFLSVSHTRSKLSKLSIATGDTLWTNLRRPIMTVVKDSVGKHDLLWAACDPERYSQDFGVAPHSNCRQNLHEALEGRIPYESIPDPVNIFMATTISGNGVLEIEEPVSRAGDAITFEAILACTVAVSACPQDMNACNAFKPTSIGLRVDRKPLS
ncbi:MAG: urea carboxylase-associated family protein [Chloroflexota bacterium]